MIVSELIEKLQALPQDKVVFLNWEGELVGVRRVEVLNAHTYHVGGSISEDYYPECRLDYEDDEAKFTAVIVD